MEAAILAVGPALSVLEEVKLSSGWGRGKKPRGFGWWGRLIIQNPAIIK
jgi:hypothetical protein